MRWGIIVFLIGSGLNGWPIRDIRKDTTIRLILDLEKPCSSFSLEPAPFRYNKDFSFSFTFDDGLISAYLVAFPFFTGGRVSPSYMDQWGHDQGGDGLNYPGLFYTDGCGNRKAFQAALAINAASIADRQETLRHPGNLSWEQIKVMYSSGWDIFNHGYSHATGDKVDASTEVRKNNEAVFDHIGCKMNQFVVPGGKDDHISQEPYTIAAFEQGLLAVHCGNFKVDWNLPDLNNIRAGRKFLSSKWLNGRPDSTFFSELSDRLTNGKKTWINAFTHSAGNEDLWGISLTFKDFKTFFGELAAEHGEKGKDDMWMATYQAVQEYQLIRNSLVYTVKKEGKRIILSIDPTRLPMGLRHKALSFVWKAGQPVKKVSCQGCVVESFTGGSNSKNGSQTVNITW
ncbi:polysaccharide deacetylase family protein [Flavitalea flava]